MSKTSHEALRINSGGEGVNDLVNHRIAEFSEGVDEVEKVLGRMGLLTRELRPADPYTEAIQTLKTTEAARPPMVADEINAIQTHLARQSVDYATLGVPAPDLSADQVPDLNSQSGGDK